MAYEPEPAIKHPQSGRLGTSMIRISAAALTVMLTVILQPLSGEAATVIKSVPQEKAAEAPAALPPVQANAPYDADLLRLSEILGSVQYLNGLCHAQTDNRWRKSMETLIELEAGKDTERRQKFVAAFNHGYRSFASVHSGCTPAAMEAEKRYRAEGATLATEITARFGN